MTSSNSEMKERPEKDKAVEERVCAKCGGDLRIGCSVHNLYPGYRAYKYMDDGQSMHFDCYIDHSVEEILKQKFRE